MARLLHETPAWKPSKLAWDDVVCQTLTSHYAVSIARGESQLVPRSLPHNPRRFTHREAARLMGVEPTGTLPQQAAVLVAAISGA